ncbi:hypothetical protein NM962_20000 [Mycobacterium sp. SVM_VP21]|nr:hypothetical protein NM962_20000 [Mycobacterium sp. SVM_VP21]
MPNSQLTAVLFVLLLLVGLAQIIGYIFVKFRQPKMIEEIPAGVVVGPSVFGQDSVRGACSRHRHWGRDDPYDAQKLLEQYREKLSIKPVFLRENWYRTACLEVTNSALCGHDSMAQSFSGSLIRSILTGEVQPAQRVRGARSSKL